MDILISSLIGIFLGGAAGYLSSLMVSKRMALVGGALGHLTLPGIALGLVYNFDVSLGALPFVLVGVLLIWLLETRTELSLEVLTAVVFAAGVASAFLILPSEKITTALIGNISQVSVVECIITVTLSAVVFLIVKSIYPKLILSNISQDVAEVEGIETKKYNLIYLICIAIVVALGVKVVGGLLTAAIVSLPAATAGNFANSLSQYAYSSLWIGIAGWIIGILVFTGMVNDPASSNLSTGPLIILSLFFFFVISLFFSKNKNNLVK